MSRIVIREDLAISIRLGYPSTTGDGLEGLLHTGGVYINALRSFADMDTETDRSRDRALGLG